MTGRNDDSDRHQYFRIDDDIHLSFQLLSEEAHLALLRRPPEENVDPCSVVLQIRSLSIQAGNILATIRKNQPDVASYLTLLDKKIDLIAQSLAGRQEEAKRPNIRANIGAGGISFDSPTALPKGSKLALRLVLFPHHLCMTLLGKVTHCESVAKGDAAKFRVGVEFTVISEMARETLIRHTLGLQSAQLRRQRSRD